MRKVKNSIKKMMALCLAAIMTLAMATTAFAARTTYLLRYPKLQAFKSSSSKQAKASAFGKA